MFIIRWGGNCKRVTTFWHMISAFTLSVPRVRTYDADAARLLLRTSRVQMESSFVQSSYATRKLNKQSVIPIPNSIHEKKPLPKRQLPMPFITLKMQQKIQKQNKVTHHPHSRSPFSVAPVMRILYSPASTSSAPLLPQTPHLLRH